MILSALTPFFETSCSHRLERDRFGSCTSRNKQAINATIVMTTPKPGQSGPGCEDSDFFGEPGVRLTPGGLLPDERDQPVTDFFRVSFVAF